MIPEEAETVALIFALRRDGMGKNGIARELNRRGIPAKHGGIWHESVIETILRNEKYQGDLLLQEQYRVDHLRKIDRPNRGELPQYLVQDNHEGIVTREDVYKRQVLKEQVWVAPVTQLKANLLLTALKITSSTQRAVSYTHLIALDKVAEDGDPFAFKLPRPTVSGSQYDFSFSGLKTAVINLYQKFPNEYPFSSLPYRFQQPSAKWTEYGHKYIE